LIGFTFTLHIKAFETEKYNQKNILNFKLLEAKNSNKRKKLKQKKKMQNV
jgi:hypothetical protein